MEYEDLPIFNQSDFLDFFLNTELVDVENVTIILLVENGTVFVNEEYDEYGDRYDYDYRYDWYDGYGPDTLEIQPFESFRNFTLKPDEPDENFNLVFTIQIIKDTLEVYSEVHTFWVVGEPVVIPGENVLNNVNIIRIFSISLVVGIVIAVIVFFIYTTTKRGDST